VNAVERTPGSGRRWIGMIAALLAGNAIAVAVLLAASSGDGDRRVLPDYYQRAAAWDQQMLAERASLAMGWSAKVAVRADAITVALHDGSGAAVAGAAVRVTARHAARADHTVEVALLEVAPGQYRAAVALPHPGLWHLDIHAHRGDVAWVGQGEGDTEATP